MRGWLAVTCGTIALALGACASAPHSRNLACSAGEEAVVTETLYFGNNMPGGVVTDVQWASFVAEVVTPRFPEGLTTWSTAGQWRGASGVIEREGGHVLHVFHAGDPARAAAVAEIAQEYKTRFAQESVLRERSPACVSF